MVDSYFQIFLFSLWVEWSLICPNPSIHILWPVKTEWKWYIISKWDSQMHLHLPLKKRQNFYIETLWNLNHWIHKANASGGSKASVKEEWQSLLRLYLRFEDCLLAEQTLFIQMHSMWSLLFFNFYILKLQVFHDFPIWSVCMHMCVYDFHKMTHFKSCVIKCLCFIAMCIVSLILNESIGAL